MMMNLAAIQIEASGCTSCGLSATRNQVVFGEGPADSQVLFLGEAPGRQEDETGRPFCGRSGSLLDEALSAADIRREDAFITSIVKCRPPANRNPKAPEIKACARWLELQVAQIRPRFICTLGNFALREVRGDRVGISAVHGEPENRIYMGLNVILFPLFHPAAALRSTTTRELFEADLKRLAALLKAG